MHKSQLNIHLCAHKTYIVVQTTLGADYSTELAALASLREESGKSQGQHIADSVTFHTLSLTQSLLPSDHRLITGLRNKSQSRLSLYYTEAAKPFLNFSITSFSLASLSAVMSLVSRIDWRTSACCVFTKERNSPSKRRTSFSAISSR